jgi:hypothetical protein
MKREPLPTRPTNADLARGLHDVHECLDAVAADITVIKIALGLKAHQEGEARPVPRVGLLTPWQLTWRIAVGAGPVLMLWQWAVKLGPTVWTFLTSVNHIVVGH